VRIRTAALLMAGALTLATTASAQQHPGGHWGGGEHGWNEHQPWHGDIRHFEHERWRGGHWWNGNFGGRGGWWWIVGPDWYWYPAPVYPFPDPFTPPGLTQGYWYYCDPLQAYYPYVGACPGGWRPVAPN